MKLQGILTDMDGTITEFKLDYMAARRRTLQELEKLGIRTSEDEQTSLYILLNRLKDELDREKFLEIRRTLYQYYEEMELDAAKATTLLPGAKETLFELKSKRLKLGLVTNNSRSGTRLTLQRLNLQSVFDAIVTRDDCDEMKPAGAPIVKALLELDVPRDDAIVVGDGALDILAAKAAGVRSAAVSTGPFPKELILKAEPDYVLNSISDLSTLVAKLERE